MRVPEKNYTVLGYDLLVIGGLNRMLGAGDPCCPTPFFVYPEMGKVGKKIRLSLIVESRR